jgi:ABC-type transport system involved in cytochrome c biogenesis permease subunit
VAYVALLINTLELGVHWYRAGHAPYITRVEVVASTVWIVAVTFLLALRRFPVILGTGAFIFSVITLAMGWVGTNATMTVTTPPLSFATTWLGVHVVFTQLFVVCALMAAGLGFGGVTGLAYKGGPVKMPTGPIADDFIYRLTATAFVFLTIMILAGSIWANHAWGRYWGWDNIEVWSLICWLIYAIELHLMRTFGWKGRKLHWLTLASLGLALFAMFGVVLVFPSIHGSYMVR